MSRRAKGKYKKWLEPDKLILLEGWARDGLTDEQIAHNMGITAKTLYEWKNKYGEICESLKRGKEVADYMVENALLKSAMEGNVTAQIFWLKNRRPEKWKDKRNVEEKVEFESDGFIEALKAGTAEMFKKAGDVIET